jgi:predicted amidophosphoribosyltransferase
MRYLDGCCDRCALPRPCGRRCPADGAAWDAAWSALAFEGPARALVHALKFDRRTAAAGVMAAPIAAWLRAGDGGTLVPTPAHPRRRRARGFDQSEVLARAVARRTGLPVSRCLRRTGPVVRQVEAASARERREAGRIGVVARGRVPVRCLLLDDVHTTGATLRACADALRDAGAGVVHALTYARAV